MEKQHILLLVEDEESHAELILRALARYAHGLQVLRAVSLLAARRILQEQNPTFVLLDYQLPDGFSIELVRDYAAQVPIVVMTSHGNEEAAVQVMQAGAIEYLVKNPVAFQSVVQVMERALRSWQLQQEKRAAELKLQQSHTEMVHVLSAISHEIRTPLNSLVAMLHVAMEANHDPHVAAHLEQVDQASQALLGVVRDSIDLSHLEAGQQDLEHLPFPLDRVLERLGEMLGRRAHEKGLELNFDIAEDVPRYLLGDPLRLGQILVQLVSNAIKFTEQGEVSVLVRLRKRDANSVVLRFDIIDTGVGLDSQKLEGLLYPQNGQVGFGLGICRRLVHLMHGELRASSSLGKGSVFQVEARFGIDISRTLVPGVRFQGRRALVVDDNITSRRLLARMLEPMGFLVEQAASGMEALECTSKAREREEHFDVVFMDWVMPGLDGLQTYQRLCASLEGAVPPQLVMVTAYSTDELLARAGQFPIHGVLSKPFTRTQLRDAIEGSHLEGEVGGVSPLTIHDANLRGKRILLVNDNRKECELIAELMARSHAQVEMAFDGDDALKRLQSDRYDLVIIDAVLPYIDGADVVRQATPWLEGTRIFGLASKESEQGVFLECGVQESFLRPLDYANLLHRLVQEVSVGTNALGGTDHSWARVLAEGGFDWRRALELSGGDPLVYKMRLEVFQRDVESLLKQTAEQVQSGRLLQEPLYSLRTLAQGAGAERVAHLCLRMWRSWSDDAPEVRSIRLDELRNQCQEALATVRLHYRRQRPSQAAEDTTPPPSLKELYNLLESFDGEAIRYGKQFARAHESPLMQRFQRHLILYHFEEALAVLHAWEQQLGGEP